MPRSSHVQPGRVGSEARVSMMAWALLVSMIARLGGAPARPQTHACGHGRPAPRAARVHRAPSRRGGIARRLKGQR